MNNRFRKKQLRYERDRVLRNRYDREAELIHVLANRGKLKKRFDDAAGEFVDVPVLEAMR